VIICKDHDMPREECGCADPDLIRPLVMPKRLEETPPPKPKMKPTLLATMGWDK